MLVEVRHVILVQFTHGDLNAFNSTLHDGVGTIHVIELGFCLLSCRSGSVFETVNESIHLISGRCCHLIERIHTIGGEDLIEICVLLLIVVAVECRTQFINYIVEIERLSGRIVCGYTEFIENGLRFLCRRIQVGHGTIQHCTCLSTSLALLSESQKGERYGICTLRISICCSSGSRERFT